MKRLIGLILVIAVAGMILAACQATDNSGTQDPQNSNSDYSDAGGNEDASSQDAAWVPEGPITMYVGFSAGGGIDVMCRTLAPKISEYLGVDVIVENMTGASSGVATDYLLEKPADGYSLLGTSSSMCAFSTTENSDASYNDLTMLAMPFTKPPVALLVKADSDIDTVEDFVAYIQNNDSTASTAGVGSTWHIPAAKMAEVLGCVDRVTFVPYDSGSKTALAVAQGEVDWSTCGTQEAAEYIRSGLVKPLAMISSTAMTIPEYGEVAPIVDSIPELAEYADILGGWRGIAVDKDTPDNIKETITAALEYAISSDEFVTLLENNSLDLSQVAYGDEAQTIFEKSTRIFSWLLFDLGDGTRSPDEVNVPRWE